MKYIKLNLVFILSFAFTCIAKADEDYQVRYPALKNYLFIGLEDKSEEIQYWNSLPFEYLEFRSRGCNGECPVYSIKFFKGGRAEYNGGIYSKFKGSRTGKVTLFDYTLLSSYIERTNLLSLKNSYSGNYVDLEEFSVIIATSSSVKEIKDLAKQSPPELLAYAALFEKISGEIKWKK